MRWKGTAGQVFTCPRNPVVPLSTKGTSAAKHRRLTCRLASKLSSPFNTTLNCLKKSRSKSESLTLAWYGVMLMWGLNFKTASRATCWELSSPLKTTKTIIMQIQSDQSSESTHFGLWLSNMWLPEQKLSVEVTDFYSIHVNLQITINRLTKTNSKNKV